jgi:hypothetical protein
MQDLGYELPRRGERRSSLGEFAVWLATRTRTSNLDKEKSPGLLDRRETGGSLVCSPSRSRPRVGKSSALQCVFVVSLRTHGGTRGRKVPSSKRGFWMPLRLPGSQGVKTRDSSPNA